MTNNVENYFKQPTTGKNNDLVIGGTMEIESGASVTRPGRQVVIPACGNAAVGATAGWNLSGDDFCHITLPAGQTGSTVTIPIMGLEIGDTLTAVSITGQIESGGNIATLALSVERSTTPPAGITVTVLGADSTGNITEDTTISSANLAVTGLSETIEANEIVYVKLTGTTAAATDLDVTGVIATVTRS